MYQLTTMTTARLAGDRQAARRGAAERWQLIRRSRRDEATTPGPPAGASVATLEPATVPTRVALAAAGCRAA